MKHQKKALVQFLDPRTIEMAPENDSIYTPFSLTDDDDLALIASVRERGVLDPLHVSADGYLLSGHRRQAAASLAHIDTVPVIVEDDVSYATSTTDEWVKVLASFNVQRDKSEDERMREVMASVDVDAALQQTRERRLQVAQNADDSNRPMLEMKPEKKRAKITTKAFADASYFLACAVDDVRKDPQEARRRWKDRTGRR